MSSDDDDEEGGWSRHRARIEELEAQLAEPDTPSLSPLRMTSDDGERSEGAPQRPTKRRRAPPPPPPPPPPLFVDEPIDLGEGTVPKNRRLFWHAHHNRPMEYERDILAEHPGIDDCNPPPPALATDHQRLVRQRAHEYYELDRKEGWCFLCSQTQEHSKAEQFPELAKLLSFSKNNAHLMSWSMFIKVVQDVYISTFRRQMEGQRGIDPITGTSIPARWWWPEIIEQHFKHHVLDTQFILEHSIKANWAITLDLEKTMKQRLVGTEQFAYRTAEVRLYLELQKQSLALLSRLKQDRAALQTKGL